LIGFGNVARHHLEAVRRLPDASLVAVCDTSRAAAEAATERYGGTWYTDHKAMLDEVRPDVVHVTTPPETHFRLALDALDAGAHVIVEKPAAVRYDDVVALLDRARALDRIIVENYTYLFSPTVQELLGMVGRGEAGEVLHVEVAMCLDLADPGSPFADAAYPSHRLPGGAITDFLPHLASVATAFVGPHRAVASVRAKRGQGGVMPSDELHALVAAERGSAVLSFSANSRPDGAWLEVTTTAMRATAHLFEPRLTVERVRAAPRPLVRLINGLDEARTIGTATLAGVAGKIAGTFDSMAGLDALVRRTYAAVNGGAPPVSPEQIANVHRLVADLVDGKVAL
jgi:predicted dehydrogenase